PLLKTEHRLRLIVANERALNSIALAIPCPRVVRLDETPSGYRWGIERKEVLLQRESITRQR
ncbi:MAG: MGMT family protein, partial [Lacipirellulaceae bacterium]